MLFSSGSTGEPKAALHELEFLLRKYRVERHSQRILTFLLFDHIGGFNTLFYSLSNYGCAITLPARDPETVCRTIERYRAELLPTSPTFIRMMLMSGAHRPQTAELVSAVEGDLGAPLTRLRVDGGLTRSRRLMQATADLTQIPLDVYPSSHATALGAAACARLSLNPDLSLEDAVADWEPATTYEPRWSVDRAAEFRHHWRAAARAALPQEKSDD